MGDFLYKRINKRLLQTTRSKMMPTLPMFPIASKQKAWWWAASNPHLAQWWPCGT